MELPSLIAMTLLVPLMTQLELLLQVSGLKAISLTWWSHQFDVWVSQLVVLVLGTTRTKLPLISKRTQSVDFFWIKPASPQVSKPQTETPVSLSLSLMTLVLYLLSAAAKRFWFGILLFGVLLLQAIAALVCEIPVLIASRIHCTTRFCADAWFGDKKLIVAEADEICTSEMIVALTLVLRLIELLPTRMKWPWN